MEWERARKPEQKAVRRDAILQAARELFLELEYDEISLNGIAREAGFSKPNVYRYFSTREEIFLSIFQEEQCRFADALVRRLRRIQAKDPVNAIAKVWVEEAVKHRTWLDLLPQLATSVERNSSVNQILEFKKSGYEHFDKLVETLQELYPALDVAGWVSVTQCVYSMMAGLWAHANPGENVLEAMQHPDLEGRQWDFSAVLKEGIAALIRGTELRGRTVAT